MRATTSTTPVTNVNVNVKRVVVCGSPGPATAITAEQFGRAIAAATRCWGIEVAAGPVTAASRAALARHVEVALAELARSSAGGK